MAGLCAPLPTLRLRPRERIRTAWGRCGSLLLLRIGLAPITLAGLPAHKTISPAESLTASERVILKHPGLCWSLAAGLEKRTQLDRIGPVDGKVELRSPVAGDAVGNRLDKVVRPEGSARS